mgnify:FL=1
MKILAVADEECKALWDYFTPDKLEGVELIIACGDLSRHYLEYLATMAPVPLLYVHGNHDESYDTRPPQGVICLDDDVYVHNGLRIAGLGGSCRYRTGAWQFTEAEMKKRINHLRGKIDRHGGIDILVTHAPLHGYGIMQNVERLSGGRVRLAAGTLYGALTTLTERGWIEAVGEDEGRRKEYRSPPEGRAAVRAELARLQELTANGEALTRNWT